MIGTCVDITAEKLERYIEGEARWDPRAELTFFNHKMTPIGVRWISRYRIGIETLSLHGVGITKMDKARLKLRSMFRIKVSHD